MKDSLTFRTSKMEDAESLKSWLMSPGVLRWFPIINDREVDDSIRFWLSYIAQGCAITAEIEGKPVGMANLYLQPFEKLKHQTLFVICVHPEMRGKGIGGALLHYLIDLAREKFKIELLHLEVYEGNPAIRLYERLGFKEYGRHKKFLKEPDGTYLTKILMEMRL